MPTKSRDHAGIASYHSFFLLWHLSFPLSVCLHCQERNGQAGHACVLRSAPSCDGNHSDSTSTEYAIPNQTAISAMLNDLGGQWRVLLISAPGADADRGQRASLDAGNSKLHLVEGLHPGLQTELLHSGHEGRAPRQGIPGDVPRRLHAGRLRSGTGNRRDHAPWRVLVRPAPPALLPWRDREHSSIFSD